MEKGLIFALLTAVSFAVSTVYMRKAVHQTGESFTGVAISVFTGALFFTVTLFFSGDWGKLWSVSDQAVILLVTAGISHFVLGRWLSYSCYRLIGANRGSAIIKTQIFYAVILGVVLLNEVLTGFLVLGVLCIAGGAILVSTQKGDEIAKVRGKGILAGVGGAFFWGTSGVLIKPAITELGSSNAAAFISFAAASLVFAGLLFGKKQREQLSQLNRKSLIHIIIAGTFSSTAQLFRYTAFRYSPVSQVAPLIGTNSLLIFFLSFLLSRNIEVFTWKVFVGIAATVLGTFLLFQ